MAIYHIRSDNTNKTGDKFSCISERSRPEPTLDWYHNGVQIKDSKMIEENSKILKDGTYRKTSTLLFPFHESLTGSNIIECKVSIESHINMISVPYFIRRDDGTKDLKDLQADNGESKDSSGNIIIYVCLCGVIIILSVALLCMSLIFCRRNLNPVRSTIGPTLTLRRRHLCDDSAAYILRSGSPYCVHATMDTFKE
ncbi:hypothetical protein FSP39_015876 [Pinctada imbricata]|uniref:Ig-like domain-containing protein n=1 Tax=Pinctada imbricata TaxID=66713 RepID=A0AA88XT41_PINIB|nr:hypothetical protein FSP39_015876 [Pinctada imbricata]